jgi:hypothetical protein
MLTDEQVELAAAETMVTGVAIRTAALTLCGPRDAHSTADVIAVTIRLLQHTSGATGSHWSVPPLPSGADDENRDLGTWGRQRLPSSRTGGDVA